MFFKLSPKRHTHLYNCQPVANWSRPHGELTCFLSGSLRILGILRISKTDFLLLPFSGFPVKGPIIHAVVEA